MAVREPDPGPARAVDGAAPATPPILEAHGLRKTYRFGRVDVPVLRGASLTIHEGEWVAILGASGSGKSTLLHLLGDLDQHDGETGTAQDGGEIRFLGQALDEFSLLERNRYRNERVGFVFQFYHLLPELNVVENTILPAAVRTSLRSGWKWLAVAVGGGVALGLLAPLLAVLAMPTLKSNGTVLTILPVVAAAAGAALALLVGTEAQSIVTRFGPRHRAMRERATDLLELFGLGHRLRHRPRELSGGERQRVAIARALINEPDVLLADEPTGNLDAHTGAEILDLLAEQHQRGMTIVMVTHDPKVAARADRQVTLEDGVVLRPDDDAEA